MKSKKFASNNAKYNTIHPIKSSYQSRLEFEKVSTDSYQVKLFMNSLHPLYIGYYLNNQSAFLTKRNEKQFHKKTNSFSFNYDLVHQDQYPIDFFKVNYHGLTIDSAGLAEGCSYYITKHHLLSVGIAYQFSNCELQLYIPISEFSETLDGAFNKDSIQMEIF